MEMTKSVLPGREKVLEVKDLRISFRTNGGTVKAVRGISFALYKGRTLAIVGESGSGKSVTSKAILGILANNKIVEDGQIIFDGKDLLQTSEEAFSKIRGVKISMIFQDPLSSLNPIMIVGKQLTEAMVLKNKAAKKAGKKNIRKIESLLKKEDEKLFEENKGTGTFPESLFLAAVRTSLNQRAERAKTLHEQLDEFIKGLGEKFSVRASYKAVKPLIALTKACQLSIAVDPDDNIATFKTVLKDIVDKEKAAKKFRALSEKDLAKYQAKDVFDLPPAIRAKSRETILTHDESRAHFKAALVSMDKHLLELAEVTEDEVKQLTNRAIHDYEEAKKDASSLLTRAQAKARAIDLLREVGIDEPERRFKQYPFELSGGMRQRIVIAIALSSSPEVLICDEPTTALDVTIQAQILELINRLKDERHLSIVFITHDLGVVANMADDIAVMYAGKIVEFGTAEEVFYDPRHPYTWALLGSMPDLDTKEKLHAIPGTPPNMLLPPRGDAFAPRNEYALKVDELLEPTFFRISPTHYAATWMLDERAPDVEVPSIVIERIAKALKEHPDEMPEPENRKNSVLDYLSGHRKEA